MPIPVMAEVKAALEPFHPRIRSVVERAWAEHRAVVALRAANDIAPIFYPRTIANDVFDAIARFAIAEFSSDPSVHIKNEAQTFKLFFRWAVCARFKKGDDSKLGQNHPTQASLAFEEVDGLFPGLPPQTSKVEFIWLANDLLTRLERVLVVARDGDNLLWEYDIEAAEGAGSGTVIPFPEPPAPPPSSGDDLVTPKAAPAKKSDDGKE